MRRSIGNLLARKILTLPRLAPTHTTARLVERLVPSGTHVVEYQPIMTVQCSPDMIADPADRVSPDHQQIMLLECMEEGVLHWNADVDTMDKSQMFKVGTVLGKIDDGYEDDEKDEDWHWQAYLHDSDESEKS